MRSIPRTIVALAALLLVAAPLAPAQAYPDPAVTIVIDPDACAGEALPFSASTSVSGEWIVTYDGQSATGSGTSVSGTFDTDAADAGVSRVLTATNSYVSDGIPGTISATADVVLEDCDAIAPVDEETDAGDGNGILPGTGGQSIWWLVAALALLALGAGTLTLRRRG